MTLAFGSVCSGIEAASVAWKPLGWRCAFMSEIEAFPRAVLAHHYPEIPLHGDFTTIQAADYEPIDLLVGGTPCQSFSVAGLRGGLDDDRGNLALEYLRLADRLRPRWLVWENVPGVLSSNGGRDFGAILGGMVELGYGVAYRVLDAQHFGVAQRRRRVFVVGCLGDWRRAAAVLFERESLSGNPAPRREAGEGVAVSPSLRAQSNSSHRADSQASIPEISHCLNAGGMGRQDYETETVIAHALRGEGFDASGGPVGLGVSKEAAYALRGGRTQAVAFALRGREGGAMPEVGGERASALRAASGGSSRDYVAFTQNQRDELRTLDVAGALAAEPGMKQQTYVQTSAVRRLTPVECARLQGFPDDYLTQVTWRGKSPPPDGPMYRALGNSMAVPVMAWIGRRIEAVEALQSERAAA